MPRHWMISNRNKLDRTDDGPGLGQALSSLSFWTCDKSDTSDFTNWRERDVDAFRQELVGVAGAFPNLPQEEHEKQKHVTLFVHGYNNTWDEARVTRRSASRFTRAANRWANASSSPGRPMD